MLADLLAARVFLTMLGGKPAQPTARQNDTFHIYEIGRARKTILLLHGLSLFGARPGVTKTVVTWFVVHLEHTLGIASQ